MKWSSHIFVPIIIASVFALLFWWASKTMLSVLLFVPLIWVALFFQYKFYYKTSPNPTLLLPLYLLVLSIQFLHFAEEYLTGFNIKLPGLMDQDPYPMDFWVVFNMVAYFVFVLGAIIIFRRISQLMIVPLFFVLAAVILNAIGHVILAIYIGGYFPGLYTAIIYLLIAPFILRRIFKPGIEFSST